MCKECTRPTLRQVLRKSKDPNKRKECVEERTCFKFESSEEECRMCQEGTKNLQRKQKGQHP